MEKTKETVTAIPDQSNASHLKLKFIAKLASNFASLVLGLATISLVPRTLGPAAYGAFEFLTAFFQQVTGFLDMGTSTCFYTKASQRHDDVGLVRRYFLFVALMGVIVMLVTLGLTFSPVRETIWPGQSWLLIAVACLVAFLTWATQVVQKSLDAHGVTVRSERILLFQRLFAITLLLSLFAMELLVLESYFYYFVCIQGVLLLAWWWLIRQAGIANPNQPGKYVKPLREYVHEFYDYSHPLLTYALMGLVAGVADRWLLQHYAGSVEQGYFGMAFRVGAVCLLFTGAMTQLLTREFSRAWSEQNLVEMGRLFQRYIPLFYAIATYFSMFVAVRGKTVALLFGGREYAEGALALSIMALYPMLQTYGQLSGAIFYASGQTRLYRNIGIGSMLFGLPVLYLMIAPLNAGGMMLGAVGLAMKILALSFVSVNAQLWFNARLLGLDFSWFLWHQIIVAGVFGAIAWISTWMIGYFGLPLFWDFLLSGVAYTMFVGVAGYGVPRMFGLERRHFARFTINR